VVSVRNVLVGITSTATALVGGQFLDWLVFPINYQILFTLGFTSSLVSAYYLTRIRVPTTARAAPAGIAVSPRGVRGLLSMLHAGPGYTRFAVASFVFQWGLFFAVPLYSIYWVRTLHATDGWVGLINMVASATTILFYPLWGRLTGRRGNRIAMIVTTAGLAGYPFLMPLVPHIEWMLFVSFWGGVFSSGQALAFFNGLLEVCPEEHRATRIAAYNTLANIAAFISPLVSTALLNIFAIEAMLMVGAAMRLFGALLIWQQRVLMKERHSPNEEFFGKMETVGGRTTR
jgi:MFS family permease